MESRDLGEISQFRAQNHFWVPGTPKILAQLFSTNFERTTPLFAILAIFEGKNLLGSRRFWSDSSIYFDSSESDLSKYMVESLLANS